MNPTEFINPDLPGYVVATSGSLSIPGIFEKEYIETDDISGLVTSLFCAAADLTDFSEGDTIVINSVSYVAEVVQEQDEFFTLLVLRRV